MTQPPRDRAALAELYRLKVQAARDRIRALSRRELAFSLVRLVVFFIGVALFIALLRIHPAALGPLALTVFIFIILLLIHRRYMRAIHRERLTESFYQHGLARLEQRWAGAGTRGQHHLPEHHPYAADLDLFGKGSLFELLCLAASHAGQATLAAWLLKPAAAEEIRARQEAVRELAPRLEDREALYRILRDAPRTLDTAALVRWATAPPIHFAAWERLAAAALSAVSISLFIGATAGAWSMRPFAFAVLAQLLFFLRLRDRVTRVVEFCQGAGRDLISYVRFCEFIETARFESARLRRLQAPFTQDPARASARVRRLDRLVGWLNDGRFNMAFALPARLLFLSTQLSAAIERWRQASGARMVEWIHAAGELEALASLAAFACENPGYVYPELAAGEGSVEAETLGHPLLPYEHRVCNDLRLDGGARLLVVSGSNMSGKSTFLRTIGVNVVLALAGAPVCARRMRLSPLNLYALIRKDDSLQEGISRFYREIMRVREIIEFARRPEPLLFLIDEIFDGTNSHDRRVASEAIVRTLVERGAIGLITSHDLALTEIAGLMAPRAANVHFEDAIEGDRLVFDYRLREGAVQRGNALLLMRSIGLDV